MGGTGTCGGGTDSRRVEKATGTSDLKSETEDSVTKTKQNKLFVWEGDLEDSDFIQKTLSTVQFLFKLVSKSALVSCRHFTEHDQCCRFLSSCGYGPARGEQPVCAGALFAMHVGVRSPGAVSWARSTARPLPFGLQ